MNKTDFIEFCKNELKINDNQVNQLLAYKSLIQTYNKQFNLTRLDAEDIIYDSFFMESILPFKEINFNPESNQSLLDIGTGSGIPGIILKIVYPELKVSLLESNTKKCNFLTTVIKELNLENIDVINDRAEVFIRNNNYYEKYDYVTSRAVSELKNILELSVGYAKINGLIIQPKSVKYNEELLNAEMIIAKAHLKLINTFSYVYNEKQNNILVFQKTKPTPSEFPREWNKLIK